MGRRWEAENEANGGKENMLPTLVEEELEFLFSLSRWFSEEGSVIKPGPFSC